MVSTINPSAMPSTIGLMDRELGDIAWKYELQVRRPERRRAEADRKRRCSGKKNEDNDELIVFDETPHEADHTLALEILAAYEDRDRGVNQSVAHIRKMIPSWMTWPMLNEWAQRTVANYNARRTCEAIEERIFELQEQERIFKLKEQERIFELQEQEKEMRRLGLNQNNDTLGTS